MLHEKFNLEITKVNLCHGRTMSMQCIQYLAKPCPRKLCFSTFRYLKPNLTDLTELKILFSISNKA